MVARADAGGKKIPDTWPGVPREALKQEKSAHPSGMIRLLAGCDGRIFALPKKPGGPALSGSSSSAKSDDDSTNTFLRDDAMSRMTAPLLLLGMVLTASSGCGTVLNLNNREQIYGGTSLDASSIKHAWKDLVNPEDQHELSTRRDEGAVLASCCDLPLSAMGDTFTLPVTCYHWVKEKIKPASADAPATHMDPVTGQPVLAAQPTARNADKSAN